VPAEVARIGLSLTPVTSMVFVAAFDSASPSSTVNSMTFGVVSASSTVLSNVIERSAAW
jgi:hypothetical protein